MSKRKLNDKRAATDSQNSLEQSRRRRRWSGAALLFVLILAVYWPSISGGFILDDDLLLTNNELVKAPDGLYRIWLTTEPTDYWPVTNSSFWIEWRLWKMNPTGYHVTNLALHFAACLLLWKILETLRVPGAFAAALLFAVHPVNVESVAWIAQRKNTLALVFFLLSILWYLKNERRGGRALISYALSLAAFALAMLSKGSVVILPAVLLLLAWWQRGRIGAIDLAKVTPFLVIAVALSGVDLWFKSHGTPSKMPPATFAQHLAEAGAIPWFYLAKGLLPIDLLFIYPQWNIQPTYWLWWLPLAGAICISTLLARSVGAKRSIWKGSLAFAWAFFVAALVPVMGFVHIGYMKYSLVADHYQQIALLAVVGSVAAAWTVAYRLASDRIRGLLSFSGAGVVLLLCILTLCRSNQFRDAESIYKATLSGNEYTALAHYNLGLALAEAHRDREALPHFERAIELDPNYAEAHNNLGNLLLRTNQIQQAIDHYQIVVKLQPDKSQAYTNLGAALAAAGRPQEALTQLHLALQLNPSDLSAETDVAMAYALMNSYDDAVAAAERAIKLARAQGETADAKKLENWLDHYRTRHGHLPGSSPSTVNP